MSSRYRMLGRAAGGVLIAAWCVGAALGQEGRRDEEPIGQSAEQNADAKAPPTKEELEAIFWEGRTGSPETYRSICEKPTSDTHADLCQQWKAAKAAEEAANWAFPQFVASCMTVIGLIITIIYSVKSTHAARRMVDIADKGLTTLERPFVYIAEVRPTAHRDPATGAVWWSFYVVWNNSGRTPTRRLNLYCERYLAENVMPHDFIFAKTNTEDIPSMISRIPSFSTMISL